MFYGRTRDAEICKYFAIGVLKVESRSINKCLRESKQSKLTGIETIEPFNHLTSTRNVDPGAAQVQRNEQSGSEEL
ncbi:hypothetical protein RP20_CCG009412 [Aedes albopictus]|nr:hypothetical protein RP20_CCG009412 [Aedes albopictus]